MQGEGGDGGGGGSEGSGDGESSMQGKGGDGGGGGNEGSGDGESSFRSDLTTLVNDYARRPDTIHRKGGGMNFKGDMGAMSGAGKLT
jgi:hypothetical protein